MYRIRFVYLREQSWFMLYANEKTFVKYWPNLSSSISAHWHVFHFKLSLISSTMSWALSFTFCTCCFTWTTTGRITTSTFWPQGGRKHCNILFYHQLYSRVVFVSPDESQDNIFSLYALNEVWCLNLGWTSSFHIRCLEDFKLVIKCLNNFLN